MARVSFVRDIGGGQPTLLNCFFLAPVGALYAMMNQRVFDGCTITIGLEKEFRPIVVAF